MNRPACHTRAGCRILPPHILRAIAQNGTPQQRAAALQTLATDNTLRNLRAAQAAAVRGRSRAPQVLAAEVKAQRAVYDTHHSQNLPGDIVRA